MRFSIKTELKSYVEGEYVEIPIEGLLLEGGTSSFYWKSKEPQGNYIFPAFRNGTRCWVLEKSIEWEYNRTVINWEDGIALMIRKGVFEKIFNYDTARDPVVFTLRKDIDNTDDILCSVHPHYTWNKKNLYSAFRKDKKCWIRQDIESEQPYTLLTWNEGISIMKETLFNRLFETGIR